MRVFVKVGALALCAALAVGVAGCASGVDKTELSEVVAQAEAIDTSRYSPDLVSEFESALYSAKAILEGNDADEEAVDRYTTTLRDLMEGLHVHEIEDVVVDTEATCAAPGEEHGTCSICGATVRETIERLPHTPGEWEVTKNFTISSSGSVIPGERSLKCTTCGQVIETEPYTIELSMSQSNAMRSASSYLSVMPFSHDGLVEQLEYEGYPYEDAVFAADNCGADWNEQAAKSARSYLDIMPFSRQGLIDQLVYEGYTYEQATYGVDAVGL